MSQFYELAAALAIGFGAIGPGIGIGLIAGPLWAQWGEIPTPPALSAPI